MLHTSSGRNPRSILSCTRFYDSHSLVPLASDMTPAFSVLFSFTSCTLSNNSLSIIGGCAFSIISQSSFGHAFLSRPILSRFSLPWIRLPIYTSSWVILRIVPRIQTASSYLSAFVIPRRNRSFPGQGTPSRLSARAMVLKPSPRALIRKIRSTIGAVSGSTSYVTPCGFSNTRRVCFHWRARTLLHAFWPKYWSVFLPKYPLHKNHS